MTTAANRRRADDARITLDSDVIRSDGLDVAMIDQLTNLRHLAQIGGVDWDRLIHVAQGHFEVESIEKV
jgi:hypothetical protein